MENTYLLALDGDVDFRPEAVRLLVDRMKKNKKVGAACGRIHPVGSGTRVSLIGRSVSTLIVSGPMVWYQKFEYAIGHWLQKAAEHILGCVVSSPMRVCSRQTFDLADVQPRLFQPVSRLCTDGRSRPADLLYEVHRSSALCAIRSRSFSSKGTTLRDRCLCFSFHR